MNVLDRSQPPAPSSIRPFRFPRIERRSLANGLRILSARNGDLPLVTAELVLDAGAAAEPSDTAGLALLVADALETGTHERTADQLAWDLEHLGVELEASAGWDAATVRMSVPRERLEPAMDLFAAIIRGAAFPEREFERLRQQQLATILQRRKEPRALAADEAVRFIFPADVPYARPIVGTRHTVERIDRDDAERFYAARFRPAAAALVLVGDLDADTALAHAERVFGEWNGERPAPVDFDVRPAVERTTVFVVDRPGAVQSEIRIGRVGVARHHPDFFALLVMNTILGGAFTSRLNMSLRERHGFTYGARSGFAFRRKPGPFIVQAAVATDVTARAVEEALREMRLLCEEGAGDDEVAAARDYLTGILPLELQTNEQIAARFADLFVYDLPDDYFQHYRDQIARVSPDDVLRVARDQLRLDELAIVIVGDAGAVTPALRDLGVGPVEVHAVE